MVMGLSRWSLLGAVMAAVVTFGAYMYWGLVITSANQLGVEKYVAPELELAQPKPQSGVPPQATKNSSSGTEAPAQSLSSEDTPPILNDSGPPEPRMDPAVATETPSLGDTVMLKTSAQPLPVQAAGVDMPAASCTSQIWCADPPRQMPDQNNVTIQDAPACKGNNGGVPCTKEKPKEKPLGRHSHEKRSR